MNTSLLLVDHYMLLIKNIAYLAANGIDCIDRMNALVLRASEHLIFSRLADETTCKMILGKAIQDELTHLHSQHPLYAEYLRIALHKITA